MNWLELPDNERRTIVDATLLLNPKLNENVLEKDWWVIIILKALFKSSCKDYLTFKGGTSLAKWNLIERFSEDIDVAFDKSMWGLAGENKSQRDNIRKRTRKYIKETLIPELEAILVEMGTTDFSLEFVESDDSDKDPTVIFVPYRSLYASLEYVPASVKIEFSSRSLKEPRKPITIKPYFIGAYPQDFKEFEFDIMAVSPSRTFLEKVFLLHEELQKNYPRTLRMTRHLYDLEKLMDTDYAKEAYKDTGMYVDIVKHRSVFNALKGIDYKLHHPKSINIIPSGEILQKWEADYAQMQEHFIYGKSLPFNELIGRLKVLQEIIRSIEINDEFFDS